MMIINYLSRVTLTIMGEQVSFAFHLTPLYSFSNNSSAGRGLFDNGRCKLGSGHTERNVSRLREICCLKLLKS